MSRSATYGEVGALESVLVVDVNFLRFQRRDVGVVGRNDLRVTRRQSLCFCVVRITSLWSPGLARGCVVTTADDTTSTDLRRLDTTT